MHILAILGAVAAAILLILFRIQQASNAARDIADGIDPLVGRAQSFDGLMSQAESAVITDQMIRYFGASTRQAEELLARARWLVQDRTDPGETIRRLTPVVLKQCGPQERAELVDMLTTVAHADGDPREPVLLDIRRFAKTLKE